MFVPGTLDRMARGDLVTELAKTLSEARSVQNKAGRELHGRVIPPLQAAAMMLQLLRLDHPETGAAVQQILAALDQGMEHVRNLSGVLAPSPVFRVGLKGALRKLVEQYQASFPGTIESSWTRLPRGDGAGPVIVLDVAGDLLRRAVKRKGAKTIRLALRGLAVILEVDGGGPLPPASPVGRAVAEYAGFRFHQTLRKCTIVVTARR
jgi:hypothetical protein